MGDDRMDFSALDPTRDPARLDRAVGAILEGAALELARRRARGSAIGQVAGWWRPMLAAAAAIIIVALTVLTQVGPSGVPSNAESEIAQALGVPTAMANWIGTDSVPSAAQMFSSFVEASP